VQLKKKKKGEEFTHNS